MTNLEQKHKTNLRKNCALIFSFEILCAFSLEKQKKRVRNNILTFKEFV